MFQARQILTHQNHSDDPLCSFARHFRRFFMGMENHVSPGIKHIDPKRLELNFKLRTEEVRVGCIVENHKLLFLSKARHILGEREEAKSQAQQFLIFFLLTFLN